MLKSLGIIGEGSTEEGRNEASHRDVHLRTVGNGRGHST